MANQSNKSNKMISHFEGKPATEAMYREIDAFVMGLGTVRKTRRAQVSYGVKRKFLWLWAYEKTVDGTLYLNVTLDRQLKAAGVHAVTQTSANRWNHQVEVKSARTATSQWLRRLIGAGFDFASR